MQIIPARKDYVGESLREFNESKAPERFAQHFKNKESKKRLDEENKAIKDRFDIDLSNITNQDDRKIIMTEMLKRQGKEDLLNKRSQLIGNALGSNQEPSFSEEIMGNNPAKEIVQPESNQQQQKKFDASTIPDEMILQIGAIDPEAAREVRAAKDSALKNKRSSEEFEFRKSQASPELRREQQVTGAQATSDVKYNTELQAAHKLHDIKTQTLEKLDKLNEKGVTGKAYEKFLEKAGFINLTSEGRREFAADVKNLITDIRSILGGQFSNFEFQTILNAYPSQDFSKEANSAIIKNLKEFQHIRSKEFEFANQLKKENKGKLPEDFQSKVNDRLQEYAQTRLPMIKENTQKILNEEYGIKPGFVLLFDPQGEPLNVPQDRLQEALEKGAIMP